MLALVNRTAPASTAVPVAERNRPVPPTAVSMPFNANPSAVGDACGCDVWSTSPFAAVYVEVFSNAIPDGPGTTFVSRRESRARGCVSSQVPEMSSVVALMNSASTLHLPRMAFDRHR